MNIDEIKSLLISKADKVEILNLDKSKAEKIDLKLNENMNVISQKQMKHIIILLVELIKNNSKLCDQNSVPGSNFKYLYKQALTIFNWMSGYK